MKQNEWRASCPLRNELCFMQWLPCWPTWRKEHGNQDTPYCTGCRPRDKKCAFLKKRCRLLLDGDVKYCYECEDFPCERLEHLDKRYRTHFRMSMIENLEYIRDHGINEFLEKEQEKWQCPTCSGVICCHNGICFDCGLDELKSKKKMYRWEE